MNNPYLLPGLRLSPKTVQHISRTVPERLWDTALEPDRFTFREAIAHLADWEPILRERVKTALESPGATVEGIDEGHLAVQKRYSESDPVAQADLFATEREITVRLVQSLQPKDWNRTISHVEKGVMTVADQVTMLLGHDIYHLEQLVRYMSP